MSPYSVKFQQRKFPFVIYDVFGYLVKSFASQGELVWQKILPKLKSFSDINFSKKKKYFSPAEKRFWSKHSNLDFISLV